MKTRININQIAKLAFISAAAFVIPAAVSAQADRENFADIREYDAYNYNLETAYDRLEAINETIEKSVKFVTPSENDDIEAFEAQAAMETLDDLNRAVEESVKYKPATVNEDVEAYELETAKERLEDLSTITEQSLKYKAPAAEEFVAPENNPEGE